MLRYESKPETSKGIAIFTGTLGTILLYFAGFVASDSGAVILFLFALALLIFTVNAASARYTVTVDRESGKIVKEFNSLMFKRKWNFRVDQFNSVQIGSGGRGSFGEGTVVYCAQLKGFKTLQITLWSDKKSMIEMEAQKIAQTLSLQLE